MAMALKLKRAARAAKLGVKDDGENQGKVQNQWVQPVQKRRELDSETILMLP